MVKSRSLYVAAAMCAFVTVGGWISVADRGKSESPSDRAAELAYVSAPAAQKTALKDGRVSISEVREALAATVQCGEAQGFRSNVIVPSKGQRAETIEWIVDPAIGKGDTGALADRHERLMSCYAQYSDAIIQVWDVQHVPSADQVTAMYDWLQTCVDNTSALDPAEHAQFNLYPTAPQGLELTVSVEKFRRYIQCAAEYESLTGFQAPPPSALRPGQ